MCWEQSARALSKTSTAPFELKTIESMATHFKKVKLDIV
jgi:hypothetical protein